MYVTAGRQRNPWDYKCMALVAALAFAVGLLLYVIHLALMVPLP